jgi:hypothetical protein
MKRTELERQLASKINNRMKQDRAQARYGNTAPGASEKPQLSALVAKLLKRTSTT